VNLGLYFYQLADPQYGFYKVVSVNPNILVESFELWISKRATNLADDFLGYDNATSALFCGFDDSRR
jgi:hypothetical protein